MVYVDMNENKKSERSFQKSAGSDIRVICNSDARVLLLALGLICATLFLAGCSTEKKNPQAAVSRPAPEVGVVVVTSQRLPMTMELPGRISARLVAEVRPQVSGIIKERLFVEGSEVRQGEVLYQIDPASYKAVYASAKAVLAKAEANLVPLKNKENRYRGLVASKAVSQQDYDDVKAGLMQAEADVAAAKAAVDTAGINLDYTTVVAPISGRIGRSAVTTGALVTAGQQAALATIQQLDTVNVDVTQASVDMLRLKRAILAGELQLSPEGDAPVQLVLEDDSRYPNAGSLKFSEVTVDQSTGSVTMRTIFPNPEGLLLPGMFVRAILATGIRENAILVPQQGVTYDQTGQPVSMIVGSDNKVVARKLQVDRAVGNQWLVSEGLKAGDQVIVEGVQKVRPGTAVNVVVVATNSSGIVPQTAIAAK